MATKRKTGIKFETFKHDSSIAYKADEVGGSVHANKHFSVKPVSNGTVGLTTAGSMVLGELFEVSQDGYCSVGVEGQGLQGLSGAANDVDNVGTPLVGAAGDTVGGQTGGYVKKAQSGDEEARFIVTDTAAPKNSTVTYNA